MSDQPLILIVDDDPAVALTLEALLIREGYRLEIALNGQQALDQAASQPPDAVLLDVMMPDIDGFEVCRRLRADPLLGEVPILMVTALDDQESRLEGLRAGADDFLSKPVDRLELQARLRTITRLNRYRRLVAERQRLAWVLEQSSDGYVVLDRDDGIVQSNAQAHIYLGLPADDSGCERFLDLARSQYRLEPEEAWADWPQPGTAPRYLVRPETPTAAAFWLEVATLRHAGIPEAERVIQLRDVTDRIAASQGMRAFHMLVSHKLRTPLFSIVGSLELLADRSLALPPEDVREMAAIAVSGAERLRQTVEDILGYIQASKALAGGESFALADLAGRTDEVAWMLRMSKVTVILPPELGAVRVMLPRRAMDMILLELLENARKFHPRKDPVVRIRAESAQGGSVRVLVEDDGLTLSPEQIARAFIPYAQAEKYFTGETAGMGLGLALVGTLLWNVGGSARVYNRPGAAGIIVDLTLPRAAGP